MAFDVNHHLDLCLKYLRSKNDKTATAYDKYLAISNILRKTVIDNWINTHRKITRNESQRVYYISMEYNLGSPIKMHVEANGLEGAFASLLKASKITENEIFTEEPPINLSNGFIGEFSGNILEALATNGIATVAYGLWYKMGLFRQAENSSEQLEAPYYWSSHFNPWIVDRPEYSTEVNFSCKEDSVVATPLDYPISGYHNKVVNTLRFWDIKPTPHFSQNYLLHNDYIRACDEKEDSVKFLRYLFVDELSQQTSELHVKQQYFLASASIKDIFRRYLKQEDNNDVRNIYENVQIILADSRSAFAILEFVKTLTVEHNIGLEEAILITRKTFVVSLPIVESGEFPKIPLYIFEAILPDYIKIINDINHFVLEKARAKHKISDEEAREISIMEEGPVKKICLANLAILFSGTVFAYSKGGAEYISEEFEATVRLYDIDINPEFSGVSFRRWLLYSNEPLANVINSKIGNSWITDNSKLIELAQFAQDSSLQKSFMAVKAKAKEKYIKSLSLGSERESYLSQALLVSHLRRITLSNAQILMLFYIASRYIRITRKGEDLIPRLYLFGGRALPHDFFGKQLVSLIKIFAKALKDCPQLSVRFIDSSASSFSEDVIAMSDITEFVSSPSSLESSSFTALRASANGILSLAGTNPLDISAVSQIAEDACFYLENIDKDTSNYDIAQAVDNSEELTEIFALMYEWVSKYSDSEGEDKLYPLLTNLRGRDELKLLAYFDEYSKAQDKIDATYQNKSLWTSMALKNIAYSSKGSLDNVVNNLSDTI